MSVNRFYQFAKMEQGAVVMGPELTSARNNPMLHTIVLRRPGSPTHRTAPKPNPALLTERTSRIPSCSERLV